MTAGYNLFISPHLDDAVLSCGGYIRRIAEAGDCAVVVTVVTADSAKGPSSWFAQRNHMAWRAGDSPFAVRRAEDKAATSLLGGTHVHLGMLDAMYRRDDAGNPLYASSIVGVPVHPHDSLHFEPAVRESLRQLLRVWAPSDVRVFCSLAVGGHVDHVIVRRAVESLWNPSAISYYEDYPYASRPRAVQAQLAGDREPRSWHPVTIELSPGEVESRVNAAACYVSQVPGLFPSQRERLLEIARARLPFLSRYADPHIQPDSSRDRMASSLRTYIARVGGERYWQCSQDRTACHAAAEMTRWTSEELKDHYPMQLTRLESFDQFRELKEDWDALSKCHVDTVFLTHDWLSHWWSKYQDGSQLWTLVLRDSGGLAGVVPLILQRGFGGLRRIAFMGVGEVTPNHLDIIARPEIRPAVEEMVAEYLCQTTSQWDVIELDKLPGEGGIAERLGQRLRVSGLSVRVEVTARCPIAELPDSFDAYLQGRGARTRRNFCRTWRHLEDSFPTVRLKIASTPEDVERALTALIEMHQSRWRRRGYMGAFATQRFVRFHLDMARSALEKGYLRLYSLQDDAWVLAVLYGYRVGDCIQDYLSGFDERWSAFSPGMACLGRTIEQSILEGVHLFDMLEGEEPYKYHWATGTRNNVRLRVYSPRWRGRTAKATSEAGAVLFGLGLRYLPVKVRRRLSQMLDQLKAARASVGRH